MKNNINKIILLAMMALVYVNSVSASALRRLCSCLFPNPITQDSNSFENILGAPQHLQQDLRDAGNAKNDLLLIPDVFDQPKPRLNSYFSKFVRYVDQVNEEKFIKEYEQYCAQELYYKFIEDYRNIKDTKGNLIDFTSRESIFCNLPNGEVFLQQRTLQNILEEYNDLCYNTYVSNLQKFSHKNHRNFLFTPFLPAFLRTNHFDPQSRELLIKKSPLKALPKLTVEQILKPTPPQTHHFDPQSRELLIGKSPLKPLPQLTVEQILKPTPPQTHHFDSQSRELLIRQSPLKPLPQLTEEQILDYLTKRDSSQNESPETSS